MARVTAADIASGNLDKLTSSASKNYSNVQSTSHSSSGASAYGRVDARDVLSSNTERLKQIAQDSYNKKNNTLNFGSSIFDKDAYELARNDFMDWMLNTGSSGGANNKNYGYDWSDPEDVDRYNTGRISKKYEASYSDSPYDQWLKANGQASSYYFDSKYYANAHGSVMADRAEKQAVQNFRKAVVHELWSTSDDPTNTEFTGDDVAAAAQRLQLTNPQYANIKLSNPKTGYEQDFSNYTSPMLAEQEAAAKDAENRATSLYLDDVLGDISQYQRKLSSLTAQAESTYAEEQEAKANEYQSIIDQAIANSGYSEEIDRRVGLAKDSTIDEWNANKELKRQAATNAVGAMEVAGAAIGDIKKAIRQDGRLSYIEDSEQGIKDEATRIERRDASDVIVSEILAKESPIVQASVAKAKSLGNMGTAAQAGFSPISMMEGFALSDEENAYIEKYMADTRLALEMSGHDGLEIDNAFRRADLGEYIPKETARTNYAVYTLSEMGFSNEEITAELNTYTEEGWARIDKDMAVSDYVEDSTIDIAGKAIISVPIRAALSIASGAVGFADMVGGVITNRTEAWEITDKLNEQAAYWQAYSHDRNHEIISESADVASEVLRMYATSMMGTGLAAASTKLMSSAKGAGFLFNFLSKNASRIPFVSGAIGNYYTEAMNEGTTARQAAAYAIPAGLLEGYLESLEMGQVMKNTFGTNFVGKKIAASGLSANFKQLAITKGMPFINFALDVIGEGVEESLSAVGSSLLRTATWDEYHQLDMSDVWENAKGGLILGAVMGGLSMPAHTQSYKYASEIYKNTGDYSKYIDSLQSAVYVENMDETKRNALITKAENGEVAVDREAAIDAEADVRNAEENIAAKKAAVEAAEEDAAIKIEAAKTKVGELEKRIATLRENNGVKKAKKISELSAQLSAAKKSLAQVESESQKKVATATADYQAIAAKSKKAIAKNQQTVDEYHAAKYVADTQAAVNAVSAPQTAEPNTNTTAATNTPQNLIDTVKTDAVETAEPVVAETVEISPEMDFGAGGVAIDGTAMASEGVFKESRVSSNTLTKKFGDEAIKVFKDIDPDFGTYEVISEETSMRNAENWINEQGIDRVEYELLDEKRNWGSSDVDAAMMIITQQMSDGGDGNPDLVSRAMEAITLAEQLQGVESQYGQVIQALAKWTRTPAGMAVEAVKQVKKTQKKILEGNASKRKTVDSSRKAAKKAKKEAVKTAAAIATENALVVVESVFPDVAYSSNNSMGESAEAYTFRRTKKRDPIELLSKRIVSATKPKSDQELDYVQRVVRDLFGVAKESPILRVDDTSTDQTYSNVGEAYSLKTYYQDIWDRTKHAVLDIIGDDVALNVALDDYFRTGERPIISQKAIDKAYNKAMGEIGADMRSIITKTADQQAEMRDALVDYVIQQTGVDEDGAVALAMEIVHTFNRERTKATANFLKSQLGNANRAGSPVQSAVENIEALVNAGALVDATYSEAMMEKLDPKLRKAIKQSGYSIGDIISRGALAERQQFHQFMNEVVGMNLSDADLDTIATMAADTFRTVVAEDKQKYLNRQFAESKGRSFADDSLTSVEKLVNAGLLTNEEIADKVADKLDSKFRKTIKELGIDVKSVVEQGVDSVADAAADFAAQADGLNISDSDKQQIRNAMLDTFNEMVAEVKDKYAQTLINRYEAKQNPTEKQPPMDNIQKVLYNAAMGVYSDKRIDDAILEANGLPVVTEEDITYIKANMEKALEARRVMNTNGKDALYEGEKADYQIRRYQEEAAKVIASKMSVDGRVRFRDLQRVCMLLNSKTLIKNFSANIPTAVLENIKDNPAALADIITSKFTGKRTTQGTTLAKVKAQAEGFKKGVTETVKDYKYGVNTSNANMLGRYSAFEDGDVINRTTNAQPRVWGNKTIVGRTLNNMDKLLSAGMTLGDRPFFEAAAASRATELEALGYDVNTDESQLDIVRFALDRVFQNNSDLAQAASSIRGGLNQLLHVGDVGLGDLVMPFVQTPSNIADKLIDYSGVGGAARGIIQVMGAKKTGEFDQKLFVDRIGRSMTGFGVMALGAALAKCGALVLGAKDDEERQAMNNAGVKEFSITTDGETYHTVDWADPVANVLFIGGALGEMGFDGASIGQAMGTITGVAVDSIFQMSVLQNVANLLASNDNISENLLSTAENFPTQFVQSTINAVARTVDPYERETYSPDKLQQIANKMMAKIPGLRERLPKKLNTAGQEVKSYRGDTVAERFFQSFISPGYTTTKSDDVVHSELWRLHESGGFDVQYLPKAYKTINSIQLTTEQYQEYQRILGDATYSAALDVIESAEYKKAEDKDKAAMLDKAISKAISSKEVKEFKASLQD